VSEEPSHRLSIANVSVRRIVVGEVDPRVLSSQAPSMEESAFVKDGSLDVKSLGELDGLREPTEPKFDLSLHMIIEVRTDSAERLDQTQAIVLRCLKTMAKEGGTRGHVDIALKKSQMTDRYAFIKCDQFFLDWVTALFAEVQVGDSPQPMSLISKNFINRVFRIWHDNATQRFVFESGRTIKVDAVHNVFSHARGKDIVWAVLDTGIDGQHAHFKRHKNLILPEGLKHIDLTGEGDAVFYVGKKIPSGFDQDGHGTHVAGIIAGEWQPESPKSNRLRKLETEALARQSVDIATQVLSNQGKSTQAVTQRNDPIVSIAPECKILAIKILKTESQGKLSDAIVALQYIQRENQGRARLKIHGVNLSVGFPFDASWYPAGSSPICKEVDRLVQQGVCVVIAAGNSGYSRIKIEGGKDGIAAAAQGTIADPGNSKLAITVGSTHRSRPRSAGVSYFSSKGPTADGRMKPDVVAPGERIVSARAGQGSATYVEMSGTSMAAPHVSGAIACLMSARDEFIGAPDLVKARLKASATDLGLIQTYQGAGLIDAFELISSGYRSV
jgi:serine protease AprX